MPVWKSVQLKAGGRAGGPPCSALEQIVDIARQASEAGASESALQESAEDQSQTSERGRFGKSLKNAGGVTQLFPGVA